MSHKSGRPAVTLPRPSPALGPELESYLSQLVRSLEFITTDLSVIGPIVGTTLNLSDIPISADGLTEGDVWANDGILTIVAATTDVTPITASLTLTSFIPSVFDGVPPSAALSLTGYAPTVVEA